MRTSILYCLLITSTSLELFGQENLQVLEDSLYYQMLEESMSPLDFPAGAQVDAHQGDSLVLVAFYDSTGGPSAWLDRTGWLQGPVHQWLGISLDASGRVRYIQISGNRLKGTIPSSLGQLANLEVLNLQGAYVGNKYVDNEFSGGIPPELSQLENLQSLRLTRSGLDGAIPVELMQLSNLTELDLQVNRLTGEIPPEVVQLANLWLLNLRSNRLSPVEIPLILTQMPALQFLDLSYNGFTGEIPLELTRLTNLWALYLAGNQLTGEILPELGQMNLKYLRLGSNRLTGTFPLELLQLTELSILELEYNQLTGEIPPGLAMLTYLRDLDLAGNSFTGPIPTELGTLSELRYLYLQGNDLSGGIPPELGDLSELQRLFLSDNDLSGTLPRELGQLSNLEYLWLSNNDFSGTLPRELGQLAELTDLRIFNNRISGQIPSELGNLGELSSLYLFDNDFSGPIPPDLGNLPQLWSLRLNDNDFSGPIPPKLGDLSRVERLDLHNNDFSGPIPPELGALDNLRSLQLQNNRISGSIPPELAQLDSLRWISLQDNRLSGSVPDWTGLSKLTDLILRDNQFLFADLLPNAALSRLNRFTYAPQDTVDIELTCTSLGFAFTTPDKAEGNTFQWYRNGQPIPGAQSDTLRIVSASVRNVYHATITNESLPNLTLMSHRASTLGAAPCTTQQFANVADSTLLVDFFNRTHGSLLWHTHTGWLEEPVAQWYGITLDASGRVTEVSLPNNNLVGQLPLSQLDQLPHLRYLDVSGNEFSGVIPKGLGELTQLEYLDLSRNTLAGELPKELAGQAPLKMLNVSGNQLVGTIPTELSQITTLQTFSVSANQLSGPVPAFTGLDQLDTLHVAQNAFLFMDLLPNASLTRLDNFVYAPQDSVETLLTRTASGFALTTAAKAVGNRYQWYRDDQPISGPQSDTLQVSATSDPAQYHATIANDRLPDLTLISRKKGVHDGLTLTETDIPHDFLLHQSYPNPFAEVTTVAFELGTPEHVRIVVYDLLGKAVATIADGRFTAGVHKVEFTGDNLASGQYMYRMEAGAYQATRFMSVVR